MVEFSDIWVYGREKGFGGQYEPIGTATSGELMADDTNIPNSSHVDKSLVAMFLKMSPEDRLFANDKAVRAIVEMREACKQQISRPGSRRDH